MKRFTALRYAQEIARRIHSVNGILATPLCNFEAVRISRVWVFGSTAKGSESPNDLDVLIEMRSCGRRRTWRQAKLDKQQYRSYGYRFAPCSQNDALKWLTKGMKMVSRHVDDDPDGPRKMIYPKYEMDLV